MTISYVTRDIPASNGEGKPSITPELQRAIANAMSSRLAWIRKLTGDTRRNLEADCGYPELGEDYDAAKYRNLFERNPFASRVVRIWPREAWKVQPEVYDNEDPTLETPFEMAVRELGKGLKPERSYHKEQEGNLVWSKLKQAHIDSRIGRFGVLVFGFQDGKQLKEPAVKRPGMRLQWLKSFSEDAVTVKKLDDDPNSSRRGLPLSYDIAFAKADSPDSNDTKEVHWTRVLHLCEGDEVYANSKMKPVLNNLLDLRKIYGASGEGFWKSAFSFLSIETNPNVVNPKIDRGALKDMVEDMFGGLERALFLTNAQAKTLPPSISDPSSHIEINVQAICVELACPKRIFLGSERGELASTQDDDNWNDRLVEYNRNYTTPSIICPFFDRLIGLGVLPEPGPGGYLVYWPDMAAMSESQKLDISLKRVQVTAGYIQGGISELIPESMFLGSWLYLDKKEIAEVERGVLEEEEGGALGEEEEAPPVTEPALPVGAPS